MCLKQCVVTVDKCGESWLQVVRREHVKWYKAEVLWRYLEGRYERLIKLGVRWY